MFWFTLQCSGKLISLYLVFYSCAVLSLYTLITSRSNEAIPTESYPNDHNDNNRLSAKSRFNVNSGEALLQDTENLMDCTALNGAKLFMNRSNRKVTVLVASFGSSVLRLFQDMPYLRYFCFNSVYDFNATNPSGCRVNFVFTQQPLRITEATLNKYDIIVHLQRDPVSDLLASFQNEYQTVINQELVSADFFMSYIVSKSLLWKRFHEYWNTLHYGVKPYIILNWSELRSDPSLLLHKVMKKLVNINHIGLKDVRKCLDKSLSSWKNHEESIQQFYDDNAKLLKSSTLSQLISENERNYCSKISSAPGVRRYNCPQNTKTEEESQDIYKTSPSKEKKIHLITTFYASSNADRQKELLFALRSNIENKYFSYIHIWLDGASTPDIVPYKSEKIKFVCSESQPFYSDLFEYANRYHDGSSIFVIQNADIYFNEESVKNMSTIQEGMVYALSRHSNLEDRPETQCFTSGGSHNDNLCLRYKGSHDSFVFLAPVDPSVTSSLQFKQNTWGAENTVIEALKYAGYKVHNPCKEIQPIHSHCSNFRKSTGARVQPPDIGNRRKHRSNMVAYPDLLQSFI